MISYRLWQRRFNGDPNIVGRHLRGQTADLEILGVMPPTFAYPVGAPRPTDVWLPNVFRDDDRGRADSFSYRLQVIGRLKDDVSVTAAQAQMDQITARLAAETPRWFTDRIAKVEPLRDYLTRGVRTWMLLLLAAVGCVLLIACVNLANLMLVRSSVRQRELRIRSALGASRWDLTRAVLTESVLLSLAGAIPGALTAWFAVEVFRASIPAEVPRAAAIAVDPRVLVMTLVTAIAIGIFIALASIAQFWRRSADASLMQSTRGHTAAPSHRWLRGALVIVEVALATVLLIGSGLFLASFARVATVNLGFDPRDVLTVRVRPFALGQDPRVAQKRHLILLHQVLDDVRGIPGVETAGLVNAGLPLRGDFRTIEIAIPGRALPDIETLSQYLRDLVAERRFNMLVIGLFGLLGIVIACVGIYGVIAYVVTLRTPEIGIRAALGAAPGTILWSVLRMAALYLGGGLAIGVPAAWMLGTFVAGFLFEVRPRDPWIFAAVTAVLVATGMLAALLPARRAARVDPLTALRLE